MRPLKKNELFCIKLWISCSGPQLSSNDLYSRITDCTRSFVIVFISGSLRKCFSCFSAESLKVGAISTCLQYWCAMPTEISRIRSPTAAKRCHVWLQGRFASWFIHIVPHRLTQATACPWVPLLFCSKPTSLRPGQCGRSGAKQLAFISFWNQVANPHKNPSCLRRTADL